MPGDSLAPYRDREFLALAGTAFARAQAYSTILIALALYADLFRTSGTVEGLWGTLFAVVQLFIVLPLGRYVDVGNAKRIILAGLVLNVGVFVGYALVDSVVDVLVVRMLQGFAASVLWITGSAVVGQIGPEDSRGLWLGTYNQVGAFSSFAGDLLGGLLLTVYGFTLTYAALAAITVGAAVLVALALRDDPGGRADPADPTGAETLRRLLDRSAVRALVVFRLGLSFGKMAVIIFLPIYARTGFGMSPVVVGGILAGGKLTKAATQGYVGEVTDRLGNRHHFVLVGALVYALGVLVIPLAELADATGAGIRLSALGHATSVGPAFLVLFGAYAICGVADSIRLPASMALFVEEGEHFDAVAGSLSLRSISWKVGQVAGPVTVGAIWDATSVYTAFGTAAGLIVIASAVFAALYRLEPAPDATPQPSD